MCHFYWTWPQWFHPFILDAMFDKPLSVPVAVDDVELNAKFQMIENKEFNILFDHNIDPGDNIDRFKHLFTMSSLVHSRFTAIHSFKRD